MTDDKPLLEAFFREDRALETSGLPDEKKIQILAEYDHVLFPTVLRSGIKVLCRLTVADQGLFLLGLATLRAQDIDAARKTAGMKTAFGGIAGAETARGDDEFAAKLTVDALADYDEAWAALKNEGLTGRFGKSPQPSFFISRHDVLEFLRPDNTNKRFVIKTALGRLEFMAPLDEGEARALQAWREETERGSFEKASPGPWTMARVILNFRANRKLDAAGLAGYFCSRVQDARSLGLTRSLLKRAFDFFEFWDFLKELKASGEPGAERVVESVVREEKKTVAERIGIGAASLVVGALVGYVGFFTPTGGPSALIFIGLGLAGIAGIIYGSIKLIGAFMVLKRSAKLLA